MGLTDFHIHVDATSLDGDVLETLTHDHGFRETNFCGHPPGIHHFEPAHHLTLKCEEGREFRHRFSRAVDFLSSTSMRGYLEGEVVIADWHIPESPFDTRVPLALAFELAPLPAGQFRQTEIHITMDRDRSDPRLIERLCGTGMFAAYLPKPYGTAVVLTVQGDRGPIAQSFDALRTYLLEAGGAVAGTIKEERILNWWVSHEDVALPPVVQRIQGLRRSAA
jgi:hypothetical protein